MKRRLNTVFLSLLMVISLTLSPLGTAFAAQSGIDYVALGDSLAAGQTPNKTLGSGYADFLARQIEEVDKLSSFNKTFATPGYTTGNVLNDIENNIERDDSAGKTINIQSAIQQAEIITLDAGANDLLRAVVDPETKMPNPNPDPALIQATLAEVSQNTAAILQKIKGLNQNAEIYVMGYYNPFPYLPEEYQDQLLQLLNLLNGTIKQTTESLGATFVPTADQFNKNALSYLPNPEDIHPNKEGYLVLANAFWGKMALSDEVTFTDKLPGWAEQEIHYLTKKKVILGYESGKFGAADKIRRVHSALMLKRAIVYDGATAADPNYSDITKDTFGYDAIAKLTEADIFHGKNGKFLPQDSLKRGEMAKILVNAYGLEMPKGDQKASFSDIDGHWSAPYIETLKAHNITTGFDDGTFKPNREITRAEFSVFMARVTDETFRK